MEYKTAWKKYTPADLEALEVLNAGYKAFLDKGKTERECVAEAVRLAEAAGYMPLETALRCRRRMIPGDKIYAVCMNKALALFQLGEEPLENGMNILGAHIDSPRVDVKQNPLYESDGQAYLDTHYYGGIKKYQWVAQPMAIHGVLVKKDGTAVDVIIGEDENDPVLVFSDLLVHLAGNQMDKKAGQVITGEGLDLLVGNRPLEESKLEKDQKEAVRANVLALLKDRYGMEEGDFLSAELEIVPAGKARDCGLDRSMILAYGQDDRVCAYTSLWAMLQEDKPLKRTSCCLLVDKEEIGSVGATGMQAHFFENVVAELIALTQGESFLATRRCLRNSKMLSSDVSAGYDPLYADAFEKRSSAFLSRGMTFNKFTGSRGKSGSNDANAEYVARIRAIMDEANVSCQFCELGKVDVGGGGTIAYIMAKYGMEVIDSGVALLSMHAPYEVSSKADVYEAYRGYRAFLQKA
ncbi:MAG: aminopeptidase [Clostridiaceae bacterium]|nr:aminopeptidase [Clostridia bacterium]MDY3871040.1 aminopeptidase [Clostridiaceae bacterium]